MKSVGFYLQFLESFLVKTCKIYPTGNEELIQSETETITSDYALRTLSISEDNLQTIQMHPEKTNNTFIFL